MNRRSLEPLRYGPRKREYVLAAVALILALWYVVGGDRPEDRILYSSPMEAWQAQRDARGDDQRVTRADSPPAHASAKWLCPQLRDGLFLRWQIEHRRETGFNWHRCAYGPVWLEAARQEGM